MSPGFVRARGGSDIRDVNLNSENWAVVKAALVAGMYPNLVHLNQETSMLSSNREKKVHFHPTSILSQFKEVGKSSLLIPLIVPQECKDVLCAVFCPTHSKHEPFESEICHSHCYPASKVA